MYMRYNTIRRMDISNGPGIRVSLFVQGCDFHCPNCFNKETWNWDGGEEFTSETISLIINLCNDSHIKGLSILGGEPLHPRNRWWVTELATYFKLNFPNKDLWVWTGYKYEDVKNLEIMKYIDTLVDGQYIDELHDFRLQWKGSSNQRVINLKTKQT